MFSRKNDGNLEEYNEKYASKYDDDYIAPSEEYRSECDHDHEQSYSNINTVRECEHNHEQTYNDADTEQYSYDNYANIENYFEKMLFQGEHLLWVGSRGNAKFSMDKQIEQKIPLSAYLLITGVVLIAWGFCMTPLLIAGVLLIVLGCITNKNKATGAVPVLYALTDQRIIITNTWDNSSISLKDIKHIEHSVKGNNTGDVYITTDNVYSGGQKAALNGYVLTIQGITDPARVESIINDAIHGFF